MYNLRTNRSPSFWIKLLVGLFVLVALGLGAAVVVARNYYNRNLQPVSSSQTAVTITIPNGSTLRQISDILEQNKLIRNQRVFEQYVRNRQVADKLQAGTYSLRPNQSASEIVDVLTQGHVLKNLFTIIPGERIDQIKSGMINAGFAAPEVEDAFNPALYKDHPALVDKPAGASLEGYLYPESFQKITSTRPSTIIGQALDEMQARLTPELRASFVAQGLTAHQGVTLASIVEREVSNPGDRPVVAQVFLRRLKEGKKLESDATASYGAILANRPPAPNFDSAYNTYLHGGLPPGPISNTSAVSLQAVAHPAATDWLYFVSGDDGKTYFSHTLEEHQNLTKQHCKKLCSGS